MSKYIEADLLLLEVKEPSFFISRETLRSLDEEHREIEIQPQILPGVKDFLQWFTRSIKLTGELIESSNFFVSVLVKGSMQQLFSMIRAMQLIVYHGLIRIPLPGNLLVFLKACMLFAQMDVFDASKFYEKTFDFAKTQPINQNFNLLGIETLHFLLNSGSFFVWIFAPVVMLIIKRLMNLLGLAFYRFKTVRSFFIKLHFININLKLIYKKLVLESYFDMNMATMISLYALSSNEETVRLFTGVGNALSFSLAIFYSTVLVIFPLVSLYLVRKFFLEHSLHRLKSKEAIGLMYIGLKTVKVSTLSYNFFFLVRRFITVIILVNFDQYPYF